ncbi:MAG: hypothetical protein H0W64_01460 [Gammaproteobacteria bacterium]|nr:hypothetical protein [Gammaproteobacteria bacterium]
MLKINRVVLIVLSLFCLSACQDKYTFSYLMTHPTFTTKEAMRCDAMLNKSPSAATQCQRVDEAAGLIIAVLKEQQMDPEAFGQKIMSAEAELVEIKLKLKVAKGNLETLQKNNTDPLALKAMRTESAALKSMCRDQNDKVKTMLAIVGMGRP